MAETTGLTFMYSEMIGSNDKQIKNDERSRVKLNYQMVLVDC